jgi:hypothetical protein
VRFGKAVKVGCVAFGSGKVRRGVARRSRHVKLRRGQARFGEAWSGLAVKVGGV